MTSNTPPRALYSSYTTSTPTHNKDKISINHLPEKENKDMLLKHLTISCLLRFAREMLPVRSGI